MQQRILHSAAEKSFVFTVSETGKTFLLDEGTDVKYGARHLKRAIERLIVHPLSNLIATSQVNTGDWIQADLDRDLNCLVFTKEAEELEVHAMARMMGDNVRLPASAIAATAHSDAPKTASARSSKK